MERTSFANMECPIARAADEVGDAWTLLILREAYKGASTFGIADSSLRIHRKVTPCVNAMWLER